MYKVLDDKEQRDNELPDNIVLKDITFEELRALQDLMKLWDESNPEQEGWTFNAPGAVLGASTHPHPCTPTFDPPKSYKSKSQSFPVLQGNPNIWAFVIQVTKEIEATN